MPFQSKQQAKACFAKKSRGQAKGWDCEEWAEHTNFKRLPKRVKKSAAELPLVLRLAQAAAEITLRG
jgi:hypothetical protein